MKHSLILLFGGILLILPLQGNAQFSQGDWLFSGSGSFGVEKTNYDAPSLVSSPYSSFRASASITPNYFVIKNLAIGIAMGSGIAGNKSINNDTGEKISNTYFLYDFGPQVRYFITLTDKTALFVGLHHWRVYNTLKLIPLDEDVQNNRNLRYSLNQAKVGLVYFIRPNIGMESRLAYQTNRSNPSDTINELRYFNNNRFSIEFGLQFYLQKVQQ